MTSFVKGVTAERIAMEEYTSNGYQILAHRMRTPFGEIDLVAKKSQQLVFVEVKARKSELDHDVLSTRQQERIRRAAEYYLQQNEALYGEFDVRFDLLYIKFGSRPKLIKNAW